MKADQRNLQEVFGLPSRLLAPLYQRPYVWKEDANWEPLWEALSSMASHPGSRDERRPYFLGPIVLGKVEGQIGRLPAREIIDGQQRLTTLQLVFAALRDYCAATGLGEHEVAWRGLTTNFAPVALDAEETFKVWPTNPDRAEFTAAMTAGTADGVRSLLHTTQDDPETHLIARAYLYFYSRIGEWIDLADARAHMDALYRACIQRMQVVAIELEEADDPQQIFETINALGTKLLPADLVRNFLFRRAAAAGLTESQLRSLYENHWRGFDSPAERAYWRAEQRQGRFKRAKVDVYLHHFLTLQARRDIPADDLFSAYRAFVRRDERPAEEHMRLLRSYATIYKSLDDYPRHTRIGLFFYRLNALDTTTVYPFLLEAFKRRLEGLWPDDPDRALLDIESYLMRRVVCELTAKNYNNVFAELLATLDANDWSSATVREFLLSQRGGAARWPTDAEFVSYLTRRPLYRSVQPRARLRVLLEALEIASRGPKNEDIEFRSELTIEHLMPQHWTTDRWPLPEDSENVAKWREIGVHLLGNLTLLTAKLNPALSNDSWTRKRPEIVKFSLLKLNREWPDEWTEQLISERSVELSKLALHAWPRPTGANDDQVWDEPLDPATRATFSRGDLWSEDEVVVAYAAYVRFGGSLPAEHLRGLSRRLRRSDGSIGRKVGNLQWIATGGAHGLSSHSARDQSVVEQYRDRPEELAIAERTALARLDLAHSGSEAAN